MENEKEVEKLARKTCIDLKVHFEPKADFNDCNQPKCFGCKVISDILTSHGQSCYEKGREYERANK